MPPVSDVQFTDLETLKQWLNISSNDTGADTQLTRLITAVSRTFKELVNRPVFIETALTESVRGNDRGFLFLKVTPVTAVTSVTGDGQVLIAGTTPYQGGYSFNQYGLIGYDYSWNSAYIYSVVYKGGFPLNSEEAYMAEQAVLSTCNLWWKRRPHADELSRSLGQQITAKFTEEELPPEAKVIIKMLKRVA